MYKKIGKIIENVLVIISALLLLWAVVSYGEICLKNLDNPPTYSAWNLFNLLIENA